MRKPVALGAVVASLLFAVIGTATAAVISVGTFPATAPSYIPAAPAGTFYVPVQISGAANLQSWQFDLLFDNSVVEEVDPFDGSSGIYGINFIPADDATRSFILGGFPFNPFGLVDDVAGSYPALLTGPSGDGVLAFVLFEFLGGQETRPPNFSIDNPTVLQQVPEPGTMALLAAGLLLAASRRLKHFKTRTIV
jgi:hypothetical protein